MKQIIALIAIALSLTINATGQGITRTAAGSPYASTHMHNMTAQGVVRNYGKDTLVNGDTGYTYIFVGQGFNMSFDLLTTTVSGTVASTSNILYGVNNNGLPLTPAQVLTADIHAITGNTTYCATCIGASSTTVPGASKHYVWQVPTNAGALFDNYIIRTIQTGTATATYQANFVTEY